MRAVKVQHSDEDAALYRRAASGDKAVIEMMTQRNLGLAQNLATYYAKRNPHLDMDDLLQEGRIGIFIALTKFNVDKGYRFSTYATYWIKHYIQRYVVANHSGGASTSKKDTEAYMSKDADGNPCTEAMSESDRNLYERRCITTASLSGSIDRETSFEEIVEDKNVIPIDEESGARLEWQSVERTLFHESIEPTQRAVVCMRFGVMGYRPHTIPEVAGKLGIPPIRVTAIEQTTVARVSRLMEDEEDGSDRDEAMGSGGAEGEAEGGPGERPLVHAPRDKAG